MLSSIFPERALSVEYAAQARCRLLSWIVSVAGCVVLLAIPYYPSAIFGKDSLSQAFIVSSMPDLTRQIRGFVSGVPAESLAAEASSSEWAYCALVPVIVGWLIWRLQRRLRVLPAQGANAGYWLLGAGAFLFTVGFLLEYLYVGIVAMHLVYAGLIVLFLGWPTMRVVVFPWAFLLFMWPYAILETYALQLRLVMASLSHYALALLGVPNSVQGTSIFSAPGSASPFALDVADPCSGIRSLSALLMIAALYGFLSLGKAWQQLLLIALAAPLAVVGNLVRLVLLALATIHFGDKFAIGVDDVPSWFHEAVGYLVYIVNLGGLLLAGGLLSRYSHAPAPGSVPAPAPRSRPVLPAVNSFLLAKSLFVAGLVAVILLVCLCTPPQKQGTPGVVLSLPDQVGPLIGQPEKISPAELSLLYGATFARKSYGPPNGVPIERVLCTVVESGNIPRSLHTPERCLPAQGYTIADSRIVTVPLKSGHLLDTRFYLLKQSVLLRTGQRITLPTVFLYWYVGDGVAGPYRWRNFFITNWDLLFLHTNQRWSYVYVLARVLDGLVPGGRSQEQALHLLEAFIRESAPSFMRSEMTAESTQAANP